MPEPFGFEINESWYAVEEASRFFTKSDLPHNLGPLRRQWERKVEHLGAGFDPVTLRREKDIEIRTSWSTQRRSIVEHIYSGGCQRKRGEPFETYSERAKKHWSKSGTLKAYAESLVYNTCGSDMASGTLSNGTTLPPQEEWKDLGIRLGMKISRFFNIMLKRAMSPYGEGCGGDHAYSRWTEKERVAAISQLVSVIFEMYSAKITEKLVISINPLDILLSSECSAWTSCHGTVGCHKAGPFQYIADDHTVIQYTYKEHRMLDLEMYEEDGGNELPYYLPYKTRRWMLHLNKQHKGGLIARHYGTRMSHEEHSPVREQVAETLAAMCGIPHGTEDVSWGVMRIDMDSSEAVRGHLVDTERYLAYTDAPTYKIRLKPDGSYPKRGTSFPGFVLESGVACPVCGSGYLLHADDACCCDSSASFICDRCEERDDEDDSFSVSGERWCRSCTEGWAYYCSHCDAHVTCDEYDCALECCENCRGENYEWCEHRHHYVPNGETYEINNHGTVCFECASHSFHECDKCSERAHLEETYEVEEETICEDCFAGETSECSECRDRFFNDNLTDGKCETCYNKEEDSDDDSTEEEAA